MIAKLIKKLKEPDFYNPGVVDQRIYHVDPPIKNYEGKEYAYVFVSAANVHFSGPETYIFPCTKDGEVINWSELDGSERGILDCEGVLRNLGYEVTP